MRRREWAAVAVAAGLVALGAIPGSLGPRLAPAAARADRPVSLALDDPGPTSAYPRPRPPLALDLAIGEMFGASFYGPQITAGLRHLILDDKVGTVLIFRDRHQKEVTNYAIIGQNLLDLTPQHHEKIPLANLDLPATAKANDDRGVTFRVPGSQEGQ